MALRIVIDDALPFREEAFGSLGLLRPRPTAEIDRDALVGADALIVRSVTKVSPELLAGTNVRFVASASAGEDNLDREALQAQGITVANAPGCNAQAVADYVVSALAHGRRWRVGAPPGPVGVVGLGHVGRRVARSLRAIGYDVLACDPPLAARRQQGRTVIDRDPALDNMARFERLGTLDDVLESSFVISLHVPLIHEGPDATAHLLDHHRLTRLRHGQLLINASRGGVVDDMALRGWMSESSGKAFLDVWEGEPQPDERLLRSPGAVQLATPHIAGYTVEGKVAAIRMVHEALCEFLGRPPEFDVRPILGREGPVELRCSEPNAAHDWRGWIEAALPLLPTDQQMRKLLRVPREQRPAQFEALRKGYRLRRELSSFVIRDADLDPETHRCLAALGIGVPPNPTVSAPPSLRR